MSHDMFGDVVHPSVHVGTTHWYTVPISVLTHSVALGAAIVVPLLATVTLPTPQRVMDIAIVQPPEPSSPPEPPAIAVETSPALDDAVNVNAAPVDAPEGLKPELPRLLPAVGSLPSMTPIASGTLWLPKQPPAAPVRVGGDVRRPEKIKHVDPVYPSIAKAARVSGMVIVEATIAADGSVRGARVIRSVPMLDQAALDAVSQWRYTPTMLNSQAVEVIMSVNVTFAIK